jgi:putative ABC transport system ATP-binding protein
MGPVSSSDPASPTIFLKGVHFRLTSAAGPVPILRGIDLVVERGETVGLVGSSGSGKTSLLMVVADLERAMAGTVWAAGQDLGTLTEDALARFRRDHVGILFQNFHLVPTMTALENVALPLELADAPDALARAREGLAAVGLAGRVGHCPALYGGKQRRVALARAFAGEPSFLLAYEPTGNLDGANGEAVIRLLYDLHRRNATLLLITHDPAVAQACDRILEIRRADRRRPLHIASKRFGIGQ